MKKGICGFTLLELLVVILIIAALATVVVPQYKMAVMRVKYLKLQHMARQVMKAEQAYLLTHGGFTVDLSELDIELPPWKFEHKVIPPPGEGDRAAAQYDGFHGESLVLLNTPNYFQLRMISKELPVCFEMFDWHYPGMEHNPDVMKAHVIESYCGGWSDDLYNARKICKAFGAAVNNFPHDTSWKF